MLFRSIDVPNAKFLCVYMRADGQIGTTVRPPTNSVFRVRCALIEGARPGETNPRAVSQRLFDRLSELQLDWWKGSPLPKNCAGNDIVDLSLAALRENFSDELSDADPEWLDRHLTARELAALRQKAGADFFKSFWRYFAAKEACHKALARTGLVIFWGAFRELNVDLFRRKAVHVTTGLLLDLRFTDDDEEKIHCVAVLRGGFIGDEQTEGDVVWDVSHVPAGARPGEYARERALDFIAASNDEIRTSSKLAISEEDGLPTVLWRGEAQDWSLSLSHSGRFVACSFLIS